MSTTTNLSSLVINYLTQSQYDSAAQAGTLNENQIYLTPAVELATVATSGSYLDLSNKPTIPTKVSDLTNDSGFITSYTDEKVKQTSLNGTNTTRYLIGGLGGSQTSGVSVASKIYMNDVNPDLTIGLSSETQRLSLLDVGINFTYNEGNKQGRLRSATITTDRDWTLPNKTGTIALTSDIPDTSSFLTSETDPVFSVSAAAGITATDISNWNGKSDTDEKLSVISNSTVGSYYPILSTGATGVASTKIHDGFLKFSRSSSTQGVLSIGENGSAIGQLRLFTTTSGKYVTITPGTLTSIRTITLPDATGTVALTSDIPQVYSSTNTGGYLTMATLPIYDGTVE